MSTRVSNFMPALLLAASLTCSLAAGRATADLAVAPTYRADQFTDFVGINPAPLDDAPLSAAALGIRHYRAVLKYNDTKPDQPAVFSDAYDKYGVQAMMLIDPGHDGTPQNIVSLLKQYEPGAVAELEGPSEENNKFPPQNLNLKYKGLTDEAAGAVYMNIVVLFVKTVNRPLLRWIMSPCYSLF